MPTPDVMHLPYSYYKLEKLDGGEQHPVSFPLVVYFSSQKDRAEFAKSVKDGIKTAGTWSVGHLR
jgi:hypothetical protein